MAPKIWTVRKALVVDLDDRIGSEAQLAFQLDDAIVIAIDAELGWAREHAVTIDTADAFDAERHIHCTQTRAAIGRAAGEGLLAIESGFDHGPDIVRIRNRLDAQHLG